MKRDKATVYITPVSGIPLRKGACCYFVDWYDENRPIDKVAGHVTSGGWRGQIFHSESNAGERIAKDLGRKISGTCGPVGAR